MQTLLLAVLLAAPSLAAEGAPAAVPAAAPSAIDDARARVLYALGAQIASDYGLKAAEIQTVADGMADLCGAKPLKTDAKEYRPKVAALKSEAADARRQAQLDAYAAEPGAKRYPSGLIYKEVKAGSAVKPAATTVVKVHYHGTFPDGAIFDSSVQRGEPMEFPLNGVIPCWTEGVQLMGVGGKAKLVCPYSIAYGERGRPPVIPERSTLVFDVELLEVQK